MKKLAFLVGPAILAGLFLANDADAQCCDSVCLTPAEQGCPDPCSIGPNEVPLQAKRCRTVANGTETDLSADTAEDFVPSGPGITGCVQFSDGGNTVPANAANPIHCIGGDGSMNVTGCVGMAGWFVTGAEAPHQNATACRDAAIAGCAQAGSLVYEVPPGEYCGHCPGKAGDPSCTQ